MFQASGFAIGLLIILLCSGGIWPALAEGPQVPGGVGALPVKVPAVLPFGSVPSQSVPQVLDKAVVSPEWSSVVQPGIVSGPMMNDSSVPVSKEYNKITSLIKEGEEVGPNLFKVSDPNDITLKLISIQKDGSIIEGRMVGPGLPPTHYNEKSNQANLNTASTKVVDGADVPAMTWSYGCSPTSATMLFGYLDRDGFPNMYTGPTNGGVFPLTNAAWGSSPDGGQCPLTASQKGLDGRATKGHKDDYYYSYGSNTDPYYRAWSEHTPPDSIADYMGSNMYQKYGSQDGSTWFWTNNAGYPLYDFTEYDTTQRDGMHGMKLFAESRGYSVAKDGSNSLNYNQLIYGIDGNTNGFTYKQYKAEIDAGHPVIIQVSGHTMLGVGYSGTDQIVFHNTWDYNKHTMTWGGYYEGMQHYAVGVIHLLPSTSAPTITSITPTSGYNTGNLVTTIKGANFRSGLTAKLILGSTEIIGTISNLKSTQFTATFPLLGATAGKYDLVVTNKDKTTLTNTGFFTIKRETYSYGQKWGSRGTENTQFKNPYSVATSRGLE